MADAEERRLKIAALRYRIIAEAAESSGEGVSEAIKKAATRSFPDPDGQELIEVTPRTLWRWLAAYRDGGLLALRPKARSDRGLLRAIPQEALEDAARLRRENENRPTKTIIDILERTHEVNKGQVARSTLDRHLDKMGLSRYRLRRLGKKTYKKILTEAPFELIVADFHHGPYVRVGDDGQVRRPLLLAFIDHFSRYVPEGRYFLHEDFAALRFGFRHLLLKFGCFSLLYIDNGPSFQTHRFHAACSHKSIDIKVVHSKPYVSEGRGVVERFNRTVKEQFESEVKACDELPTLNELNAFFEAWLSERYHSDSHSETGERPRDRFIDTAPKLRAAPDLALVEELLRLRYRRTVHKKWSTVEVDGRRYVVDPALRGRRLHVLHDPFDPAYVLIEHDGHTIQRALLQRAGQPPPELPETIATKEPKTNYLEVLRKDFERHTQAELRALDLRPAAAPPELPLLKLVALVESCRGAQLTDREHTEVAALFRKLQPIEPEAAKRAFKGIRRSLGTALHLRVYLDAFQEAMVRQRAKTGGTT
jgi:putative transposase